MATVKPISRSPRPAPAPGRRLRAAGDDRLIAGVRAGDQRCFEVIVDRHHRQLLSFCRHMLGSREEAEDALQQVFVSAHRRLQDNDRHVDLRPWLYAIARNRCLSVLRARRQTVAFEDVPEPTADGLALAAQVEQRQDLQDMLVDLARLPEDQRAALILAELEDLSHDEIARALDVRRDKVKALVFQARESLMGYRQARLADCGPIREQLATLRGGALRRTALQRHVAVCPGCAEFKAEVTRQRAALGALMPVAPSVALKLQILHAVGGAGGAAGAGGATIAALSGGASASAGAGASVGAGGTGAGAVVAGGATAVGGAVTAGGAGALAATAGSMGVLAKVAVVAALAASAGGGAAIISSDAGAPARRVTHQGPAATPIRSGRPAPAGSSAGPVAAPTRPAPRTTSVAPVPPAKTTHGKPARDWTAGGKRAGAAPQARPSSSGRPAATKGPKHGGKVAGPARGASRPAAGGTAHVAAKPRPGKHAITASKPSAATPASRPRGGKPAATVPRKAPRSTAKVPAAPAPAADRGKGAGKND